MTREEERKAEGWGRKVGAFLTGLFADKKNWLIAFMLLGFGADKANGLIAPKETYWDEKDITEIIEKAINKNMEKRDSKFDELIETVNALIKAQSPAVRLSVADQMRDYKAGLAKSKKEN